MNRSAVGLAARLEPTKANAVCCQCRYWTPDTINPKGGLGRCQAQAPASRRAGSLWPHSDAIVCRVFDLRPAAIIDHLDLRNVCYTDTSSYGHFSSSLLPWEDVDRHDALRKAAREVVEADYGRQKGLATDHTNNSGGTGK